MQSGLTAVGRARAVFLVALAMLAIATTSGRSADITIGSGFVIGAHREVLTNAHVVQD
jgi:S1-C subfamily serine protease